MKSTIENLIRDVNEDVIRWRRHIHANPDLSFQEKPTADYIARELATLPELELSRPVENSVIAVLHGDKSRPNGRCVRISTPCRYRKRAARPSAQPDLA
jgi:amidohydrolase